MSQNTVLTSTPDLCIIGGGTAGYTVAVAAAALGVPTVLIDEEDLASALPRAGDVCWEMLVAAARQRKGANGPDRHGPGSFLASAWAELQSDARAAAEAFAPEMSARRLRALGVEVLQGTARFRDPTTLEVGGRAIRARRFVIATGASPAIPPLPGLDLVAFMTARTFLDLPVPPRRLIIVGGGRTGIEAAQVIRRLGGEVAVIEQGLLLPAFEEELRATVLVRLVAEGIELHQNTMPVRVEPARGGVRVAVSRQTGGEHAQEEFIEGSHLLLATGWRPNVAAWRPDRAAVACSSGGVMVGPSGRTGNRRIYALGDVAAGLGRSMASAQAQATVVLRAVLFRQPVRFDPKRVPRVLRTDPPVAVVGLSEPDARRMFGQIRVLRWPYRDNEQARAEKLTAGHVKVVTTRAGRVLGAGIVGAQAPELIGTWALAIGAGLRASEVAGNAFPVPSFADLSRRAALSATIENLDKRWLQGFLRLIRRLG